MSPRLPLWVSLALALSCGPSSGPPPVPPPVPPVAPPPRPFLQRRTPPPPGVPASVEELTRLGSFGPVCPNAGITCSGGGGCTRIPLVSAPFGDVTLPDPAWLCVGGFERGALLEVGVLSPSGHRSRRRLVAKGEESVMLSLTGELEGPAGTYTLEVTHGAARYTEQLRVDLPKEPAVVLQPSMSAPGERLTLVAAGYPARTRLSAHVYRALKRDAERFDYVDSLELETNAYGVGSVEIPTDAADPPGPYQVAVKPGSVLATFELEARPPP